MIFLQEIVDQWLGSFVYVSLSTSIKEVLIWLKRSET